MSKASLSDEDQIRKGIAQAEYVKKGIIHLPFLDLNSDRCIISSTCNGRSILMLDAKDANSCSQRSKLCKSFALVPFPLSWEAVGICSLFCCQLLIFEASVWYHVLSLFLPFPSLSRHMHLRFAKQRRCSTFPAQMSDYA